MANITWIQLSRARLSRLVLSALCAALQGRERDGRGGSTGRPRRPELE